MDYKSLSSYRKAHFGKHIVGHPSTEVGKPMRGGRQVSATSLVEAQADARDLYEAISSIATDSSEEVMLYNISSTEYVKAVPVGDRHVEVTFFRGQGDIYEPVTSYDDLLVSEVNTKVTRGLWY